MPEQKLIVSKDNKHVPAEPGDTVSAAVIPLSAARNQGITVKADGLHVDTTSNVRVTRRKTPEGFDLQIERTPATGMQVIRITGTTSNTTSVSYDIDWSTHSFANTAFLYAGAHSGSGVLLQSPPTTHTPRARESTFVLRGHSSQNSEDITDGK